MRPVLAVTVGVNWTTPVPLEVGLFSTSPLVSGLIG